MLGLPSFKQLPKVMQVILLLNAAIYLLSWVSDFRYFELVYGSLRPSHYTELWRFLSYAFIHINFMHILFNMLMFWMFSVEVVETLGEGNFTALYLVSGVFAGVFSVPFYLFGFMGDSPIIGASGALFGVMVAYSFLFPERVILMFFIIPMKIKHAIWIFIAIDLFMSNSGDNIAHFTHLGGVLSGFLFMLFWQKNFSLRSIFNLEQSGKQQHYSQEFFKKNAEKSEKAKRGNVPLSGEVYRGNSNQKEERLNEILDKINRQGLQSLNEEERDYLQWFGQQNKKG
ncbi:rhomboid family intramembrane serine protease [Fibrobacterales bacterium]|nr:rhomboid family intramembrane serine protease [Fibrobacterales bacterium]